MKGKKRGKGDREERVGKRGTLVGRIKEYRGRTGEKD